MDTISIRYGETVTMPFDSNGDYATADIFIGRPGETFVLTKHITLTEGKGVFTLTSSDTQIPLGVYNYQINVENNDGAVEKYPSPNCDGCDLPKFIVCEALDLDEVVS